MKEQVFDLLPELTDRMTQASQEAQKMRDIKCDDCFNFVHIDDKEYINPKYISFEDQLKIMELFKFLKNHPDLDNRTLKEIFAWGKGFEILIDVYKLIPNIIEECKMHNDEKYIPYLYFGLKQNKENNVNV